MAERRGYDGLGGGIVRDGPMSYSLLVGNQKGTNFVSSENKEVKLDPRLWSLTSLEPVLTSSRINPPFIEALLLKHISVITSFACFEM